MANNEVSLESLGYKQELKRVLKLKDAVIFGVTMITPTAPFPLLGIIAFMTLGHMATAYFVALVAMFLTALSYAKMAAIYPVAGSTYSYTKRAIGANVGFMAGWAMVVDYLLIPLLSVIFVSISCAEKFPHIPYMVWVVIIASLLTLINFMGISVTSKLNTVLSTLMVVIVVIFLGLAVKFLAGGNGAGTLLSSKPFFDPETFKWSAIMAGASLAVFSFIGFDAVSTISEEVENPTKNIPKAIVFTCVFSGIIFLIVTYMAQLVWPEFTTFPEKRETVIFLMAKTLGGTVFDAFIFFIIIVAGVASALVGQASGSRLLYSMGRDNILPKGFFGYISPKYKTPVYNIFLMGILSIVFAMVSNFQEVAELVNYGAFTVFLCVSVSVIFYYFKNRAEKPEMSIFGYVVLPGLATIVCLVIFVNLSGKALILGTTWLLIGFIYLLFISKGFRKKIILKEL